MVISYEGTSIAVTAVSDSTLAGLVPTLRGGGPSRNGLREANDETNARWRSRVTAMMTGKSLYISVLQCASHSPGRG